VKEKKPQPGEPQQYQLFQTPDYIYRVFVTNMSHPVDVLVWVYNQRAGAENLIKEANNDAGLVAYPSSRWAMNCNHFQLAMLAYNLNCWLMLFNREEEARAEELKHTTLATSRLRFLFLAAWGPGGSELQRSLRRTGNLPAADATAASDHGGPQGIRAGVGGGPALWSLSSRA